MKKISLFEDLSGNAYPGRGIVLGKSADGRHAVMVYFIMGRFLLRTGTESARRRLILQSLRIRLSLFTGRSAFSGTRRS